MANPPRTLIADFAVEGFRWDAATSRYRWTTGANKNKFAAKSTILEYSRRSIVRHSNELIGLADKLEDKQISLAEFQRQAAEKLKQIHVHQAIQAANGSENLFANDFLIVARNLRQQYYSGRSLEGQPYGLKHLALEIQSGEVSSARLRQRLRLYSMSGKRTYWEVFQSKNGNQYGFRVLSTAVHCPSCVSYAAQPPKRVAEIIPIGSMCECLNQCKCSIRIFPTLEEAVKAKV